MSHMHNSPFGRLKLAVVPLLVLLPLLGQDTESMLMPLAIALGRVGIVDVARVVAALGHDAELLDPPAPRLAGPPPERPQPAP